MQSESQYPPRQFLLQKHPALKLLCAGAIGFLGASAFPPPDVVLLCGIVVALGVGLTVMSAGKTTLLTKQSEALTIAHTVAYFSIVLVLGALISREASQNRILPQATIFTDSNSYTPLPAMPAIVRGEVQRVVKQDSASALVLVQGEIDTKAFPRLYSTGILLRIRTPVKPVQMPALIPRLSDVRPGVQVYAVVRAKIPQAALLPTDMDEIRYADAQGASFFAFTDTRSLAILEETWSLQATFALLARAVERRIMELFPSATAPFALALLTGNTAHLPPQTQHAYTRTGTVHVLAVSGLHIVLLLGMTFVPLGFVRSRWLQWILALIVVFTFIGLTGNAPSALRAGIMAALVLLAKNVQRKASLLNVVAFAVVLLLVWQPSLVYSPGFQMSAGAVLGIALTFHSFEQGFLRLLGIKRIEFANEYPVRQSLAGAFALTCSASVIVAPIAAWYFGTVSLISVFTNLLIVPMSSAAMFYALIALLCSTVWFGGGELFAQTAHLLLLGMNTVNEYAALPRFAAVHGRWAFGVAVVLSLGFLYALRAAAPRVILARIVVASVLGVLVLRWSMLVQKEAEQTRGAEILPREQVVAVLIPSKQHSLLLLQDRKVFEGNAAQHDVGLERFLAEYAFAGSDSLTVCTTGAASMLIASGLERQFRDTLGRSFAGKPPQMRILATTLVNKSPRFFATLDSLDKYKIRILSTEQHFKRDSNAVSLVGNHLWWNVWRSELCIRTNGRDTCFILPKVLERWTLRSE